MMTLHTVKSSLSILGEEGFAEVATVTTGAAAVSLSGKLSTKSVVILDMLLPYVETDQFSAHPPGTAPEPTGLRVAKELVEGGFSPTQIVVVTAFYLDQAEQQLREMGIEDIMRKPVLTVDLLRVIRNLHR